MKLGEARATVEDALHGQGQDDEQRRALNEARRPHPDVEYEVESPGGRTWSYKTFSEACGQAVGGAVTDGRTWKIAIQVSSAAGARSIGLEDAYEMDPEASAHAVINVRAEDTGIQP